MSGRNNEWERNMVVVRVRRLACCRAGLIGFSPDAKKGTTTPGELTVDPSPVVPVVARAFPRVVVDVLGDEMWVVFSSGDSDTGCTPGEHVVAWIASVSVPNDC